MRICICVVVNCTYCCLLTPAGELRFAQRQQVQRCQQLQRLQVAACRGQQTLACTQLAARCSLCQRVSLGTNDLEGDIMLLNFLYKPRAMMQPPRRAEESYICIIHRFIVCVKGCIPWFIRRLHACLLPFIFQVPCKEQ